ncbi:hypothetical protein M3Y99_00057200 [Aphelenchoides fujianensis]|nr:hypothetical protein M3Y99_00057200 [Aphelenchoides fujianensis]
MRTFTLIFLLSLFFLNVRAGFECSLCQMVIGAAESDFTNDEHLKATVNKQILDECPGVQDEDQRNLCTAFFDPQNFPAGGGERVRDVRTGRRLRLCGHGFLLSSCCV